VPTLQALLFRQTLHLIKHAAQRLSLAQLRRFTDYGSTLFAPAHAYPLPVNAAGVPCAWMRPFGSTPRTVLFYLHGGTFTTGSIQSHSGLVFRLCQTSQAQALMINYRLAPEHPFPAALIDCWRAYHWLLQEGVPAQDIVCIGDSAGGNLVLALLLALRDAHHPVPAAAVCLSAMTDLTCSRASYTTHRARDPLLDPDTVKTMVAHYCQNSNPHFPLLSPLYGNLARLPPLLLHVGTEELLLSDTLEFAERARGAGAVVQLDVWPAMWHVWHAFTPFVPEAQQAITAIGHYIEQQQAGNIPRTVS
jgi:acetyl esterase/lipase